MSSANCGWLFYKKPFLGDNLHLNEANTKLLNSKFFKYSYPKATHSNIRLKTIYPGLVLGSGYMHSMKEQPENFDFGFYFDYTTGMPTIPGSSVKGVLRSLFGQNKNNRYKEQKEQLICSLAGIAKDEVKLLFNEIFEGIDKEGNPIPMHKRDKFFDAYISKGDEDGLIFEEDAITPHDKPLKDPVPNKMLKVRPNVEFTFVFELHDGDILSAEEKEELFLELLQFNGVGAKTNVGYGQFEDFSVKSLQTVRVANKKLEEISKETPSDKILTQYNNNLANIVGSYETALKEKVSSFKDDFKVKILELLEKELHGANKKRKEKIFVRIEKVKQW